MSGTGRDEPIYLSDDSDDSDDLDLQTVRRNLKTSNSTAAATASTKSGTANADGSDEDPDWVREFSVKQDEDEDHKRALSSLYDGNDEDNDNGSIIDLLSERDEDSRGGSTSHADGKVEDIEEKTGKAVKKEDKTSDAESAKKRAKKQVGNVCSGSAGSASLKSMMPLVVAPKLDESLVLLQGSGEELDLSGDMGTVGRMKVAEGQLYIDLKGGVFRANTYDTNCLAVMAIHDDEARITSVLDEAVLLTCERNLFASDQLLKGDIGSDDEHAGDANNLSQNGGASASTSTAKGVEISSGKEPKSSSSGRGRGRGRGRGSRGGGGSSRAGSAVRKSGAGKAARGGKK